MRSTVPAVALLALLAACGSGSPTDNNPASISYAGTFASDINSGTIHFATAPALRAGDGAYISAAAIQLVGILTFSGGASIDLTGTLDGSVLSLASTDYSFTGTLSGGVISGTFTGPAGESGSFSASLSSSGGTVALYCGTFTGDDDGVWSLALKPDRTGGVIVVPYSGGGGGTGKARAKSGTTDQIEVLPDVAPTFVLATGTLAAISGTAFDSVEGVWDDGSGSSGSFGGSTRCE